MRFWQILFKKYMQICVTNGVKMAEIVNFVLNVSAIDVEWLISRRE